MYNGESSRPFRCCFEGKGSSHLVHSDAVLRVKGQECKGVNDQGSIMYNGESSHPFRCCFEGEGSIM